MMQCKTFDQLELKQLYSILKARVDVFVLEQNCAYQEIDGIDEKCMHLFEEENGEIISYCRLIPREVLYEEPSIGRILVQKKYRGENRARPLIEEAIRILKEELNANEIKIHGQVYLQKFYESFGFKGVTDVYLEDGIPHIDMLLTE